MLHRLVVDSSDALLNGIASVGLEVALDKTEVIPACQAAQSFFVELLRRVFLVSITHYDCSNYIYVRAVARTTCRLTGTPEKDSSYSSR